MARTTEETAEPARFQRPNRSHAIAIARELFLAGERVDMNTLCATLGIGRTTLHRWVGDREQLIGAMLAELTDAAWDQVMEQAGGSGRQRAMEAGRLYMEATANFPPLRTFAAREPQLALRVLLAPHGAVAARIRAGFERALRTYDPDNPVDPDLIDIAVQAGTALEWAPVAIGAEPEIARAALLIRSLFDAAGPSSPASP